MTTRRHTYGDLADRFEQGFPTHAARYATAGVMAESWPEIDPARPNTVGEVEELGSGVAVTHRFVEAPGGSETVRWHLVESGEAPAPSIVYLHGIPESWWQWHYAI